MTHHANWSYPTTVWFGAGRLDELPQACAKAGMKRPLLVTDKGLAAHAITRRALAILKAAGYSDALFSDVSPNPDDQDLAKGIEAYKQGDHDGVVAFGGGSALDLGKMIAFMSGQTRPIWDFEDVSDWWTRADATAIAPVVAVPTTAGTGSEVGRASVITNSLTHEKKIIFHPDVLPRVVISDPELTTGLPPAVTAGTGLDAFAHCVEAFSSPHFHPMSHGIAVQGMKLVIDNLPTAYGAPNNLDARGNMMAAALMGAVAFQKGLGAIHAMSHPVGALFGTHHGTTNAVCMPAVLDFNAPAITERFDDVAEYLGIDGGFTGFCSFVDEFNARFDIPKNLSAMGVDADRLDTLVEMALRDPSCGGNPVPLTQDNLRGLFLAAL